jgi:hypothetical protein
MKRMTVRFHSDRGWKRGNVISRVDDDYVLIRDGYSQEVFKVSIDELYAVAP